MKRKEKKHEKNGELIPMIIFFLWLFLLILPAVFNFQEATIVGKVFMIIGSSIFLLTYIALFVLIIKDKSNDIYKTKRQKIWAVVIFVAIFVLYAWLLLRYFDLDIWGTFGYVSAGIFLIMIMVGCYVAVNNFRSLLNNEKITIFLIAAALCLILFSGLLSNIDNEAADILIKIAVGILYLFFISILLNFLVFNKSKKEIKNRIIIIAFLVAVGVALLILFPFYVQWCGLTGDNFGVFVTTYSAVVGGALTLLGVALTIRHDSRLREMQEISIHNEKILEEKKKYKPIFNFYNGNNPDNFIDIQANKFDGILDISSRFTGDISKAHKTVIRGFIIENTNYIEFYFRGIKINTREYETDKNIFVNKNAYLWIDFDNENLYLDEPVKELYMIVEDLLGNIYNVWLGIEVEEQDGVSYTTVIGSKRINIEEYKNE